MDIETSKKQKYEPLQTEEEEAFATPDKLKKIKFIQNKFRDHLQYRRVRALADEADFMQKNPVKHEDPTEASLKQQFLTLKESSYVKLLPTGPWVNIFSFIATQEQLIAISNSCKLFNQICRMNVLWLNVLSYSYPQVYSTYDFQTTNIQDVNWRDIVKEKTLIIKAFRKIVSSLYEQKDRGNKLYQEEKTEEATKCYKDAIHFAKTTKKDMDANAVIPKELHIDYLKIMAILLSNSSMAEIKIQNWPKAFYDAVKARKKLKTIKELIGNTEEYKQQFGLLEEKVIYRMKEAWVNFPMISFVRYSDQIVDGVGVGTMIEATDHIGDGIFGNAQVLMTEYERGESIKGVIINKMMTVQGRRVRIGGPCEMHHKTILHNIPNIEGASLVVEGVWTGGNVEAYKNNPEYQINEYSGYASWFDGQLDGELRHNDWTWNNNVTAAQVFRDY